MAAPKGNDYGIGNNGGRPRMYETPEELANECEAYFDYIQGEYEEKDVEVFDNNKNDFVIEKHKDWIRYPVPPTINGLALFLGFADKSSLYDYRDRKEFFHPIKRALTLIEKNHEEGLFSKSPTGHIFALKNSGWSDKMDLNVSSVDDDAEEIEKRVAKKYEKLKAAGILDK